MLLKFSVKNYRSFKETATLDLVSSTKIRTKKSHEVNLGNASVLRNAAVYGANAAGKSNLISAFRFLQGCVRHNRLPRDAARSRCKISPECSAEDAVFDIMFEKDGVFFDYGFSANLIARQVTSEWLYELSRPSSEAGVSKTVFFWDNEGFDEHIWKTLSHNSKLRDRMEFYVEDFQNSNGALFLTSLHKDKKLPDESPLRVYHLAHEFLTRDLRVIAAGEMRPQFREYGDESSLHEVSDLLGSFDTGISDLKRNRLSLDEFTEKEPSLQDIVRTILDDTNGNGIDGVLVGPGAYYEIGADSTGNASIDEMLINHYRADISFEFREESDGTKRLFDYIDLILTKSDNAVFVIDEIDRSLHSMLTQHLIELFNEQHADDHVQLIFTTHETALMRDDLLRHDEIWFVDRRKDGSSDLFPLDRFKVRSDASIDKAYLAGRYGGVPVLKQFFAETGEATDAPSE